MGTGGDLTVWGVVLAAGAGRRMGRPKGLLAPHGRPLVQAALSTLTGGGCAAAAVVVGAKGVDVGALVCGDTAIIHNLRWADGMAGSVRSALGWAGSAGPSPAGLLILPVDTPRIGSSVIRRVITGWRKCAAPMETAAVATYDNQPRNPVLIGADLWATVAQSVSGDQGARVWLESHPERVLGVECADIGDPEDLDTPEQLAAWLDADGSHIRR